MAGPLLSLKYLLCLFLNMVLDNFLHLIPFYAFKPHMLFKLSSFSNIYHENILSFRPVVLKREQFCLLGDTWQCQDIWGCHNCDVLLPRMWIKARNATQHSTMHRTAPHSKGLLFLSIVMRFRNPGLSQGKAEHHGVIIGSASKGLHWN